ncbi:hypothetical protein NIES37_33950 [Tolypothrix tenuis PCC 7101]|uniref:Uncharacterized protein n=1 Tax=Tolypothrix tenuis PCC 7101 TaxID=231146 RepID=A0A1Z4N122_9CYAN|nr:hypothetical protein [Aulosira sp. FACHB-113]BAY99413.1 hypothetical protein NIES37_33950 [Tolypothrix tenuis PCC 7101]BAZ76666.1 hypothetical protein NIES50_52650 [Aulosira laxa NIES-50]
MADTSDIKLTITFIDPDLDEEEKDQEVERLLSQMKELDEVEEVNRVAEINAPVGSKSITGYVVGQLVALVKSESVKQVWGFLTDRLGNKPIEIELEFTKESGESKKVKVKASSRKELEAAVNAIQEITKV